MTTWANKAQLNHTSSLHSNTMSKTIQNILILL